MPGHWQGHAEAVEVLAEAAQTTGKQEQGAMPPVAPTHRHVPPPACTEPTASSSLAIHNLLIKHQKLWLCYKMAVWIVIISASNIL